MGYSATAVLVYGVEVSLSDLERTTSVRGCQHPATDHKFCPECGKPMFVQKTERVDFEDSGVRLYYSVYEAYERVIGVSLGETRGIRQINDVDTAVLFAKVQEACKQKGVTVNPANFGIHLILLHSY